MACVRYGILTAREREVFCTTPLLKFYTMTYEEELPQLHDIAVYGATVEVYKTCVKAELVGKLLQHCNCKLLLL